MEHTIKLYQVEVRTSGYAYMAEHKKNHAKLAKVAGLLGLTMQELPPAQYKPQEEGEELKEAYVSATYATGDDLIILDQGNFLQLVESGFPYEFKRTITTKLDSMFETVAGKVIETGTTENTYNQRCEVHMPGQALSTYNDLMLAEDHCTDSLQTHLDNGWRIITCSPQPDQRRPDYILGRFNPEKEARNNGASRG